MPSVTASSDTRTVVAERVQVAAIAAGGTVGVVTDAARTAASVTEDTDVAQATAPGVQGPAGPAGATGALTCRAGETLGGHRIVRNRGDGTIGYADQRTAAHADDIVGMTQSSAVAGTDVNVQRAGPITMGGWAWTPGLPVFLGLDGLPTQTVPADGAAFLLCIGHAEDADTLFLDLDSPVLL